MASRPQRKRILPSGYAEYLLDHNIADLLPGEVLDSDVEDDRPPPKRRAKKVGSDGKELSSIGVNSSQPKDNGKRGPGRPRKPDHLLRRPRRPRDEPKNAKVEEDDEKIDEDNPMEEVTTIEPKDDQAIIADQQRQIEYMQEKLRRYEAHIKALENGYFDSTPPTPAMSTINSTLHAHPPRNSTMMHDSHDAIGQGDREDSPLSVYSDFGLPELFNSIRKTSQAESQEQPSYNGSRQPSLIVTLKVKVDTTKHPKKISCPVPIGTPVFELDSKGSPKIVPINADSPGIVQVKRDLSRCSPGGEIKELKEKAEKNAKTKEIKELKEKAENNAKTKEIKEMMEQNISFTWEHVGRAGPK